MKLTKRIALLLSSHLPGFNQLSKLMFGLLVAMLLSTPAVAQSVTGTVSGIVTDTNGADFRHHVVCQRQTKEHHGQLHQRHGYDHRRSNLSPWDFPDALDRVYDDH